MSTPTKLNVSEPKKKVPSWWRGAEAATATSIQAARDLGYVVGASQ